LGPKLRNVGQPKLVVNFQSPHVHARARSADQASRALPALRTHRYSTPSTMSMPLAFLPDLPSPVCSPLGERTLTPRKPSGPPSMRAKPRLSFTGTFGTNPVPSP